MVTYVQLACSAALEIWPPCPFQTSKQGSHCAIMLSEDTLGFFQSLETCQTFEIQPYLDLLQYLIGSPGIDLSILACR